MTTASTFFSQSAPVEVIVHILNHCESTRDILALVSTCREINDIWRANTAAALWPVWLREIPHVEDALLTARITQLVVDAERRGDLPPTGISPGALGGKGPQSTAELRAAFGLHCLARNLFTLFRKNRGCVPESDEALRRMPEREASVHKTIYRVLIAGAALAGAYNEPLFKAKEHADPDIACLPDGLYLEEKHLSFLEQFTVCNTEASPEEEEAVFGPLGAWLFEHILSDKEAKAAMAKRFGWEPMGCGRASNSCFLRADDNRCRVELVDGGSHPDAHLVLWEIMKMLWVYEHLGRGMWTQLTNYYEKDPPIAIFRPSLQAFERRLQQEGNADGEAPSNASPKTVHAIFFGMFKAEEVLLPKSIKNRRAVAARPVVPDPDRENWSKRFPANESVTAAFDQLFWHSGRPNHSQADPSGPSCDDNPTPQLQLKFFTYLLRRYLNLRFADDWSLAHVNDAASWGYYGFMRSYAIFAYDDAERRLPFVTGRGYACIRDAQFLNGDEILQRADPPPTCYYRGPPPSNSFGYPAIRYDWQTHR